jgi:hypothetical protein
MTTVLRKSRSAQALALVLSSVLNPDSLRPVDPEPDPGNKKKNEDISYFIQLDVPPEGLEAFS